MGMSDRSSGRSPEDHEFAELAIQRLRQAGYPDELSYDAENFAVRSAAGRVLNLHNARAEYQRAEPARRDAVLTAFLRAWTTPMQEPPGDFDDAKPDLMPVVRSRSYFEVDLPRSGVDLSKVSFPYAIVADHLCVSLAYDLPASLIQVNSDHLGNWGVSLYEALEIARQNLAERTEQFAQVGDSLYVVMHGDSYDASRLVLTELPARLNLTGEAIAMTPNRETLMYAGGDDDEALQAMLHIAQQAVDHERYISGIALRLCGDEWEPWLPPRGHPLHNDFALLAIRSRKFDYDNQQQMLRQQFEQAGDDIFVATYQAHQVESTGAVESFCTWTKDVPTLLPQVDLVDFISLQDQDNPEVTPNVPWEAVERIVGDLLESRDVYPPRFFTAGYPTAEQLAALAAAT